MLVTSMWYLDTSIIVPWFIKENKSVEIQKRIKDANHTEFVVSEWSLTEFVSAMGIKVRMKELSNETAKEAIKLLRETIAKSITLITPQVIDFKLAADYLIHFSLGLRAGDALHLAIATRIAVEKILTLDKLFLKAGQQFNLPIELI